jgi:hypothetical protein
MNGVGSFDIPILANAELVAGRRQHERGAQTVLEKVPCD